MICGNNTMCVSSSTRLPSRMCVLQQRQRASVLTSLSQLAATAAEHERAERRRRVAFDGSRLGTVGVQRIGGSLQEVGCRPRMPCIPC